MECSQPGTCSNSSVKSCLELLTFKHIISTGGLTQDGCPILTFPDEIDFTTLKLEDYRKLILYLCSLSLMPDVGKGFVLIIDRRKSKWHTVQDCLQYIKGVEEFNTEVQTTGDACYLFCSMLEKNKEAATSSGLQCLLHAQQKQHDDLEKALKKTITSGNDLLSYLHDKNISPIPNLSSIIRVQRLLAQLSETTDAFSNFWEQHLHAVLGTVELLDIKEKMEQLKLKELTAAGDSLLLRYHDYEDEISSESKKLRELQEEYESLLSCYIHQLEQKSILYNYIDEANVWCQRGVTLLANCSQEYNVTPVAAEAELLSVENFLLGCVELPSILQEEKVLSDEAKKLLQQVKHRIEDVHHMCNRRKELLQRVVTRGKRPVQSVFPLSNETMSEDKLRTAVTLDRGYVIPLSAKASHLDGLPSILFGNWEQLYRFHHDVFLPGLQHCGFDLKQIGVFFLEQKDQLYALYRQYCQNKSRSEELQCSLGSNASILLECQQQLGHLLPLSAYLLKPVQRITKYQLLLKIQDALDGMLQVVQEVNDSIQQLDVFGYSGNFLVWHEHKREKLLDLRLKPMQRHLFLCERAVLFCKKQTQGWQYKGHLLMSEVGLTETVLSGRGLRFELWLKGRSEVYIIQASSLELKNQWVKVIKDVLYKQLMLLRGEKNYQPALLCLQSNFENLTDCSSQKVNESHPDICALTNSSDGFSNSEQWELCSNSEAQLTSHVQNVG